jgi:monoamine oxidase
LFTSDLSEVSLLNALFLIRSGGGLQRFMTIEGGYQENQVDGGAQSIADRMAAELGDAVTLACPVTSVRVRGDRVEVDGVTARRVVLTLPPSLASRLQFDPPLPADRALLLHQLPAGTELKSVVVYDEPFWRADGLAGASVALDDLVEVTLDASPRSGSPGVMSTFAAGPKARELASAPADERRGEVLAMLQRRFGPKAATPAEYHERNWAEEEWSRGCSMAHFGPGVLTQYGHLLRQPVGPIHWAGTETAGTSHGAIDGAVRSGERVAAEVLQAVS